MSRVTTASAVEVSSQAESSRGMKVEFFRHGLGDEEKARVIAALDETILTTGNAVGEAERALASYLGIQEVVCVDSCTAALHLALLAEHVGPGDEVIVPTLTFVATANAVLMAGATPVLADVDPSTGCLTADTIRPHLTGRTRAIIPVHLYGQLCDMESIAQLAGERDLSIIEDAAHCLEARRGRVRPGTHSRLACFSFYATKAMTCGEGGAVATNDPAAAERIRRLSLHGITSSASERYRQRYRHWDVLELGWKYNLDNIRGALLLPQIKRLDERCARRRAICRRYEAELGEIPGLDLLPVPQGEWSARHLFPILVDASRRDGILDALGDFGVGAVVNYRPIHLLTYYTTTFEYRRGDFPAAESLGDRTISLPLYPTMTEEQISFVVRGVRTVVCGSSGSPPPPREPRTVPNRLFHVDRPSPIAPDTGDHDPGSQELVKIACQS